jgi:hypothetical protein
MQLSIEFTIYFASMGQGRSDFVSSKNAQGQLCSVLASCTDVGGVDPFVEISAGRSFFRYEDLVRLADLLEEL